MGSSGLEPPTSRLSGARSNLLSYEPPGGARCHSRPLFYLRGEFLCTVPWFLLMSKFSASLRSRPLFPPQSWNQLQSQTYVSRFWVSALPTGDDGIRTHDPLLAGQVLSQLSYTPMFDYPSSSLYNELSQNSLKIEQQVFFRLLSVQCSFSLYCHSP